MPFDDSSYESSYAQFLKETQQVPDKFRDDAIEYAKWRDQMLERERVAREEARIRAVLSFKSAMDQSRGVPESGPSTPPKRTVPIFAADIAPDLAEELAQLHGEHIAMHRSGEDVIRSWHSSTRTQQSPPSEVEAASEWTGESTTIEEHMGRGVCTLTADDPARVKRERGGDSVPLCAAPTLKPVHSVNVALYPNDAGHSKVPFMLQASSVPQLLRDATRYYELLHPAAELYTVHGAHITSMAQLRRLALQDEDGSTEGMHNAVECVFTTRAELFRNRPRAPRRGPLCHGVPTIPPRARAGPRATQRGAHKQLRAAWGGANERSKPAEHSARGSRTKAGGVPRVSVWCSSEDPAEGVHLVQFVPVRSLEGLLQDATQALNLPRPASHAFNARTGQQLVSMSQVFDGAYVAVTTGEPFTPSCFPLSASPGSRDPGPVVCEIDLDFSGMLSEPGTAAYYHCRVSLRPDGQFAMLEHTTNPEDPSQVYESRWFGSYTLKALQEGPDLQLCFVPTQGGKGQAHSSAQFGGKLAADGLSMVLETGGTAAQALHVAKFWFLDERETHKAVSAVSCQLICHSTGHTQDASTRNGSLQFEQLAEGEYTLVVHPISHLSSTLQSFEGKQVAFEIKPDSPTVLSSYIRLERDPTHKHSPGAFA